MKFSDARAYFDDTHFNENDVSLNVDSWKDINSVKIEEAMKVLKLNTDTQEGCNFNESSNINEEGVILKSLIKEKVNKVLKESQKLCEFDTEDYPEINGESLNYRGGYNVKTKDSIKYLNKVASKLCGQQADTKTKIKRNKK
jgi:hypothetical protein